jgi:hypothetical protein
MSQVIGFVHNPDSDPDVLLRLTQSLLQHIGAAAGKRAPKKFTGDRWLVVAAIILWNTVYLERAIGRFVKSTRDAYTSWTLPRLSLSGRRSPRL